MRSSPSVPSSSGRSTPSFTRSSTSELMRPPSSRGFRPSSPKFAVPRSRPGSSFGSRPSTPSSRPDPYTGTIKVSIRPKPLTEKIKSQNWYIDECSNTITNISDSTSYSFDNIFPASSHVTNKQVYDMSCAHLVESFLSEGYNCTLFAYGMTGSGKTYSMRGEDHDPGFVKLAIDDIFDKIEAESTAKQHILTVSYLEIYNEKIIDLLSTNTGMSVDLKIRDDPEFGTKIVGINSPTVLSKQHLLSLIKTGDTKRKTSATDYNARSSRSHSIMQLRLHTVDSMANNEVRRILSLCDLAGSERATSSAERRKEGAFINKSLLALSTVINKLSLLSSSNMASGLEHIPYRDSKLTRLLQPALSGSSLIVILCTVHLGASQPVLDQQVVTETYNTLRFAARAKDIVMAVNKNKRVSLTSEEDSHRVIDELRQTVEMQKREINMLRLSSSPISHFVPNQEVLAADNSEMAALYAEVKVQNEKIEHLNRLNDLQRTETVLLRNDALNEILGLDIDKENQQMMMSNLEEFYTRVNYEMEEYRAFISQLENQLREAHRMSVSASSQMSFFKTATEAQYQELLKEQEEEIMHLKETIKDKDHIIHSLTKTSKLRRLVDSNSTPVSDFAKRPSLSIPSSAGSNKENLFPDGRESTGSPAKTRYLEL